MALSLLAPIAVRPRRAAAFMVPALLAAVAVGCGHHKRTSLRPVYVTPAAPCPSGDCGGAPSVGSTAAPTSSVEPSVMEPAPVAPVRESPVMTAPPATRNAPPPVTGPAVPGFSDEPGLEPAGAESPSTVPSALRSSGSGGAAAPGSIKPEGVSSSRVPSASLKSSGLRRAAPARVRQASLGERLTPFVDDPESLFSPPKADRPWKYIVLHHSASPTGSYDSIDREHRDRLGWQGCGYHFVIGNGTESPDGRIEVSQRWTNQKLGVHCRDGKNPDVNEYGIGICLVGDLEKSAPTPKQVAAAKALVAYLGDRYTIAAGRTETHAHLAASPTSCPGRLFPTQAILGASGLALR